MGRAAEVRLLETTIRDGGYEVGHHFTEEDIALVVSVLEAAGVGYIEVGHGQGIGVPEFKPEYRPRIRSATSDDRHMRMARSVATRAKVGTIMVAGDDFAPIECVDRAADAGMDFLRLAFMPGDLRPDTCRYIDRAAARGVTVSINLMQTYVLAPADVARFAVECQRRGASWFYIVDSAGGMQANDIAAYVGAVLDATSLQVGIHAHNNAGLAVANSLAAVAAGATLIDGTLNGIGRATGNAPTEQVVLALQARGHETGIDLQPINNLSSLMRALYEGKGNDPLNFVSGAAMLHSRNVPSVLTAARERGLSATDFMVRVGRIARAKNWLDQMIFPPELFDAGADGCKPVVPPTPHRGLVDLIERRLVERRRPTADVVCEDLLVRAARHHKKSVLHLVPADLFPFAHAMPWESASLVGVSIPWPDGGGAVAPDRTPDHLLVDTELEDGAAVPQARGRTFVCSWRDLWLEAAAALVEACCAGRKREIWSPTPGDQTVARLRARLEATGVATVDAPGAPGGRVVVAASEPSVWTEIVAAGDLVVLVDRGPGSRKVVEQARSRGAQILSPPVGARVASHAESLVDLSARVETAVRTDTAAAAWVDPIVAPGGQQAVVDEAFGAILEAPAERTDQITREVAEARARALVAGRGRL